MKFKSLKLAAVVLSVCFLSFFAAGNALAAYADSGATIYGLSIVRTSGTGTLFATLDSSSNTASATQVVNVTDTTNYADATSGNASAQSHSYFYTFPSAQYYGSSGISKVANSDILFDGFARITDLHQASASAASTGEMHWSFVEVGGPATYLFTVYSNVWSIGSAACHTGADASGDTDLTISLQSKTASGSVNAGGNLGSWNAVIHPNEWYDASSSNEYTKTFSLVNGNKGTLDIIYGAQGATNCPVPLPPSLLLLAPGLLGLVGLRKRIG